MPTNTKKNVTLSYLRMMEFIDHLKRYGLIYFTIVGALFLIMCRYITVGETRFIDVEVMQYSNRPKAAGGEEYLVTQNEDGELISVEILGKPKVGDELILSVRKRLLFYGPVYRIHTPSS